MTFKFKVWKSNRDQCWYARHKATGAIGDGDTPQEAVMMCMGAAMICMSSSDYGRGKE